MQTIHKSAKTPSQKILSKNSFTKSEVIALLNALHPASAPATEPVVKGIAITAKAPAKKPAVSAQMVNVEGIDYLQFNCLEGGKPFKLGVRKCKELMANWESVEAFVNAVEEESL